MINGSKSKCIRNEATGFFLEPGSVLKHRTTLGVYSRVLSSSSSIIHGLACIMIITNATFLGIGKVFPYPSAHAQAKQTASVSIYS